MPAEQIFLTPIDAQDETPPKPLSQIYEELLEWGILKGFEQSHLDFVREQEAKGFQVGFTGYIIRGPKGEPWEVWPVGLISYQDSLIGNENVVPEFSMKSTPLTLAQEAFERGVSNFVGREAGQMIDMMTRYNSEISATILPFFIPNQSGGFTQIPKTQKDFQIYYQVNSPEVVNEAVGDWVMRQGLCVISATATAEQRTDSLPVRFTLQNKDTKEIVYLDACVNYGVRGVYDYLDLSNLYTLFGDDAQWIVKEISENVHGYNLESVYDTDGRLDHIEGGSIGFTFSIPKNGSSVNLVIAGVNIPENHVEIIIWRPDQQLSDLDQKGELPYFEVFSTIALITLLALATRLRKRKTSSRAPVIQEQKSIPNNVPKNRRVIQQEIPLPVPKQERLVEARDYFFFTDSDILVCNYDKVINQLVDAVPTGNKDRLRRKLTSPNGEFQQVWEYVVAENIEALKNINRVSFQREKGNGDEIGLMDRFTASYQLTDGKVVDGHIMFQKDRITNEIAVTFVPLTEEQISLDEEAHIIEDRLDRRGMSTETEQEAEVAVVLIAEMLDEYQFDTPGYFEKRQEELHLLAQKQMTNSWFKRRVSDLLAESIRNDEITIKVHDERQDPNKVKKYASLVAAEIYGYLSKISSTAGQNQDAFVNTAYNYFDNRVKNDFTDFSIDESTAYYGHVSSKGPRIQAIQIADDAHNQRGVLLYFSWNSHNKAM